MGYISSGILGQWGSLCYLGLRGETWDYQAAMGSLGIHNAIEAAVATWGYLGLLGTARPRWEILDFGANEAAGATRPPGPAWG